MEGHLTASQLTKDLAPRWEARWPGRFAFELNDLEVSGITPYIHERAIKAGSLVLTFDRKLTSGTVVTLRATYPDSFPHLRPEVMLLDGAPRPSRHCNPIDGTLCLLGRDSAQWPPDWTLRRLLDEQLDHIFAGTGDEDPQAEANEVWWNHISVNDAYCLVDSAWEMEAERGTLRLLHAVEKSHLTSALAAGAHHAPIVRALINEVRDASGKLMHTWQGPVPPLLRAPRKDWQVPWLRLPSPFVPAASNQARGAQLEELLKPYYPTLQRIVVPGTDLAVAMLAVVAPSELTETKKGLGWTFLQISGRKVALEPGQTNKRFLNKHPKLMHTVPVYRAGPTDLGHRVPAVQLLKDKRIVVVGAGAIGAPIAVELARNGVAVLHLIEHDVVEPGNSVRWPLGASAWGQRKLRALARFIEHEYPSTTVITDNVRLGGGEEDDVLTRALADAHIVIDASASQGVTSLLASRRNAHLPLIGVFATPPLSGGVVARYGNDAACPNCLEHAWADGSIAEPAGRWDKALTQPPGCAERTFTGASFDLQELSLQTVRLALRTLQDPTPSSLVLTLNFDDDAGLRLPTWRRDPLRKHERCECRP